MEWSVFHNYRRLAQQGKTKFLKCPDCYSVLVAQPDKDANPILWCLTCDTKIFPGLDLYEQIKAVVSEHHV